MLCRRRPHMGDAMLRPRLAGLLAALVVFVGAGAASALYVPVAAPAHGVCSFSNLAVQRSGGTLTVAGSGTCTANGVSTPGTLNINAQSDVDICAVRAAAGVASLTLDRFGTTSASARITAHASTATVTLVGAMVGEGTFAELPLGLCGSTAAWTGALAF